MEEIVYQANKNPDFLGFEPKTERFPKNDEDCTWNYFGGYCNFPQFCAYRYAFGDLTLDQSCRLRVFTSLCDEETCSPPSPP